MRQIFFGSNFYKYVVEWNPFTQERHTAYMEGRDPCVVLASGRKRRIGCDDTERPTSLKVI